MEYLHHFSLAEDPFRNDHVERFSIETPSAMDALRRVDRAVRQSKGLVVLLATSERARRSWRAVSTKSSRRRSSRRP